MFAFPVSLRDVMDEDSDDFAEDSLTYSRLGEADKHFASIVFTRAFRLLRLSLQWQEIPTNNDNFGSFQLIGQHLDQLDLDRVELAFELILLSCSFGMSANGIAQIMEERQVTFGDMPEYLQKEHAHQSHEFQMQRFTYMEHLAGEIRRCSEFCEF